MKRITTRGVLMVAAGVLLLSASSCKKNDNSSDNNTPPPIGGYNTSNDVASSSLIAHWTFDNTYNEVISNTAPATSSNTSYTSGVKGQSVSLNNGYLFYSPITAFNALKSFTVSSWVQVANNGPAGTPSEVFNLARPKETFGNINITLETGNRAATNDTLVIHPQYADTSGGIQDNINDPGNGGKVVHDTAGKWIQIITTYDMPSNTIQIYANGTMVGTTKFAQRGTAVFKNTPTAGEVIGAWYANVSSSGMTAQAFQKPFNGKIDELRVYNKALSQSDITSLYQLEMAGR